MEYKALNVLTAQMEAQYPADVVADNRVKTLLSGGKREPVTASGNRTSGSAASRGQSEAAGSPQGTAAPAVSQASSPTAAPAVSWASGPTAQTGVPALNPASSPSPPATTRPQWGNRT